jgi:signal transduction histidine kinase
MNLTGIISSSFARVAAIVAAIAASAALVAFIAAYFASASVSHAQLRQLIDTDAAGLAELFAAEGVSGLAARIDDRLALRPVEGEAPVYAFADSNGRMLAGNLTTWPNAAPLDARWVDLDLGVEGGRGAPVLGRALLMPQDNRLFVGRTTDARRDALAQLRRVFIAGFAGSLGRGVLGGLAAAGLVRGKVARLNAALHAVRDGAVDQRAPGAAARDEFGVLARNINSALDRIERLMTAQREVNDLTAHELKSPLLRIDHTLAGIKGEAALGARAQLEELAGLIDALLDISAVSAQIGDARGLETVDLAALVRQLGPLFGDVAQDAGITLELDCETPVLLTGSPVQLSRLAANLIDNAVKFSSPGGRVSVSVRPGPVLMVSDQGAGVPIDARERIFTRFVRTHDDGHVRGHGLGLSFVHAAARRHGLSVSIDTAQWPDGDRGACFTISRPATPV